MLVTAEPISMSLAEFLTWDDGTDMRNELIDGQVRAMGLSTVAHGIMLANLACAIHPAPHPTYHELIRIGVLIPGRPDTFYVPDLTVAAGPVYGQRQEVPAPILIAEIVDRETFDHDCGRKLDDYRTIPSVRDILMISVERQRVEHLRRLGAARWRLDTVIGEQWLRLEACADLILTSEIYAGVVPSEPSDV
jgi:Uma2 family endonuclease